MLEAMAALAERSVMERIVLLANHVIEAEPEAMRRLAPHAGKQATVELEGWPVLLPSPPSLSFRVTPPGLVEWIETPGEATPALRVVVDARNPARLVAEMAIGKRPTVTIDGDAGFATDIDWLIDHLRWDVEGDLARAVGAGPARAIAGFASQVAAALREAAARFAPKR